MKLIFVHGRDQQNKDPSVLKTQWLDALNKGLDSAGLTFPPNVEVIFPFYGDKLAELISQLNAPLSTNVIAKGMPQQEDLQEAAFRSEFLEELRTNAGITDAQIQNHYQSVATEKGLQNSEWVQAIIRSLDGTWASSAYIEHFMRDVFIYLANRNVRDIIDEIVGKAITDEEPCVIVGHSLGSIIAYNILRKLGDKVRVQCYVTVGSPLGIKTIQKYIVPPTLAMPQGLKDWRNAFDDADVVALRALDISSFPITPLITNKSDVHNHTDNYHGIAGYLDDPEIARWIYDAIIA